MAIVPGDIKFKLSTKTGTGGSQRTSTPAESLGKYMSTTEITSAQLNNLFDDVTGAENAASGVEYRCIFIHNAHATLALTSIYAWLSAEASGGADIAISPEELFAARDYDFIGSMAQEIAGEDTAPGTATFTAPTGRGSGAPVGAIGPGGAKGIWIRRTAADTAPKTNDSVTIKVEGDTAA